MGCDKVRAIHESGGRCNWESGMRSSFVPFIYLSTTFCHEFVACLRDMLICKNSPVLPMAFVYAFVCRPSFAAVINAANKGNKFDSIEIIFKRGTKWELFPSKELDFSVFLQCYSCQ